jgi:endonuclease/exonuclease/phosphatase family metal-dependent hydrolase
MVWKDHQELDFFYPKKKLSPTTPGVVSYNIQYLPWKIKPLSELREITRMYPILLIQECFNRFTSFELHNIFPEYYIARGRLQGFGLVNSGLVTLSQYPIVKYEFIPFNKSNVITADFFSNKGFLNTIIQLPDKKIAVINTHLQSCEYNEYDPVAKEQLAQLLAYAENLPMPYLIGGDFNIDYKELSHPLIKAPSVPTIYTNLITGDSVSSKKDGYKPFTLDYFFVHPSLKTGNPKVLQSEYSDHNPIFLLFEEDVKYKAK